jgi:hypothetical protein
MKSFLSKIKIHNKMLVAVIDEAESRVLIEGAVMLSVCEEAPFFQLDRISLEQVRNLREGKGLYIKKRN